MFQKAALACLVEFYLPMSSFQPAKLLILASTLNKAGLISKNGKAFFKELILGRDPRCAEVVRLADAMENHPGVPLVHCARSAFSVLLPVGAR